MTNLSRHWITARLRPALVCWFALALCALATGCVQRRLMIRTNPPGALVYVDDYEIGVSPVATDFVYYGTRKIRIVKDGYETLTVLQPIPTPWYEYTPFDFISENLVPWEIRDTRVVDYQLVPQVMAVPSQVLDRAEQFRQGSRGGTPVLPGPGLLTPPSTAPASTPAGAAPLPGLSPQGYR